MRELCGQERRRQELHQGGSGQEARRDHPPALHQEPGASQGGDERDRRNVIISRTVEGSLFLETLADLMQQISAPGALTRAEAFARTYQILGAINYFAVSDPTLKKILGNEAYADVEAVFLAQLET